MVREGWLYAGALLAAGAVVAWLAGPAFGAPLFVLAAFCLFFFRDPERVVPEGPVAVSPADGKIVAIDKLPGGETKLSIFLNILDVHVNRAPLGGVITDVQYRPGRFLAANRSAASVENEQNVVLIRDRDSEVELRQIAGLIARRVVLYRKPGDRVARGERIGLIKFGSRVDVKLGPEWELEVRLQQRVRAGSSILARRRDEPGM